MITRAKVNLSAVKTFELSVAAIKDYSIRFNRGINCLENLFKQLADLANTLRDNAESMTSAQESLAVKIRNIEGILSRLTAKLNHLEGKLSDLETQLMNIPSTITITDEEGNSSETDNPAYDAMIERISAVKMEIDEVKDEMFPLQARLDYANSVNSRLSSHIDAVNGVIYSLEEKKHTCTRLRTELEEIQRQNLVRGSAAFESLNKIEVLISDYLRIKMTYENVTPSERELSGQQNSININININKSTSIQEQTVIIKEEKRQPEISIEEVKKHNIRLDDEGRIASYDGKTFGGKYNPYDNRLKRTPVNDNPILGRYEGIRGENNKNIVYKNTRRFNPSTKEFETP